MSGLLAPGEFAGDDGAPDDALVAALAAADVLAVVGALATARVFVPVVAVLGETGESSLTGLASDKSADMALVTLTAPDGRQALPVFSSAEALAGWDARARPVPVRARRAALSAVDDGCDLLVVDPGGAGVVVPRPALWAVARDEPWVPSPAHPDVVRSVAEVAEAVGAHEPALAGAFCEPGRRAELAVVLALRPGLDRDDLVALTTRVSEALAARPEVADLVDSLELRVVPA
ncbi:SseB family protein [Angustibacter speluncae]